jgi:hypothetical protein
MKIISKQECEDWLKANLRKDFVGESFNAIYPHCASYHLPVDTGKKTALARTLTHALDGRQPGLFWITAWGIFPSSENMALFDRYRLSLGENRPIHDAPGHIFSESDLPQLECLLDLSLYFFWDATLFDGAGTLAIKIGHDEYISLYAPDEASMAGIQGHLERLKLKQLAKV